MADAPGLSLASRTFVSAGSVGATFVAKWLNSSSLDKALVNTSKGSGPCEAGVGAKSAALTSLALADDAAGALVLDALTGLGGLMASPLSCAEVATTSVDALAVAPGSGWIGADCVDCEGSSGVCLVVLTLGTAHPLILPFNCYAHDVQMRPFSGCALILVVLHGKAWQVSEDARCRGVVQYAFYVRHSAQSACRITLHVAAPASRDVGSALPFFNMRSWLTHPQRYLCGACDRRFNASSSLLTHWSMGAKPMPK